MDFGGGSVTVVVVVSWWCGFGSVVALWWWCCCVGGHMVCSVVAWHGNRVLHVCVKIWTELKTILV